MYRGGTSVTPAVLLVLLLHVLAATSRVQAESKSSLLDDGTAPFAVEAAPYPVRLLPLPLLAVATSLRQRGQPPVTAGEDSKSLLNPSTKSFLDEKRVALDDREIRRELDKVADFLTNNPFLQAALSGLAEGNGVQNDLIRTQLLDNGPRRLKKGLLAFQLRSPDPLTSAGSRPYTKNDEQEFVPTNKFQQPEDGKYYNGSPKNDKGSDDEEARSKLGITSAMFDLDGEELAKLPRKKWVLRRLWKGVKRSKAASIAPSSYKRQLNLGNRLMCQLDVRNC